MRHGLAEMKAWRVEIESDVSWQMGHPRHHTNENDRICRGTEIMLKAVESYLTSISMHADGSIPRYDVREPIRVTLSICVWNNPVAMLV